MDSVGERTGGPGDVTLNDLERLALSYCRMEVANWKRRWPDAEEAFSAGLCGAAVALSRVQLDRPYRTFLRKTIAGRVAQACRDSYRYRAGMSRRECDRRSKLKEPKPVEAPLHAVDLLSDGGIPGEIELDMERLCAQMGPRFTAVCRLLYAHGLKMREAARMLGLSIKQVRVVRRRFLQRARRAYESQGVAIFRNVGYAVP